MGAQEKGAEMAMAEPMKTILAKYPDVGEQESVRQAIIQVVGGKR